MNSLPQLDDLLLQWESAWQAGRPVELEALCQGWPEGEVELRRRVEQLRRFETFFGLRGDTPPATEDPEVAPSLPGYTILEELGRGGMGRVYRARQEVLGREVALKVLRSGSSITAAQARRFGLEARVLARLRHDHIVSVHEAQLHLGQPFFAMELIRGGSLAKAMPHYVHQPRKAVQLLEQVARAVAYAHEQGVLHRDLKPSNILLDEHGRAKVSDFGLAKMLDVAAEESVEAPAPTAGSDEALTAAGAIMGTPPYMAPEQFVGNPALVTRQTDIWALGAILYELLAGRRPFQAQGSHPLAQVVTEQEPIPLSKVRPRIDPALQAIVWRCLKKTPAERYASAGALAGDLANWLQGRSVSVYRTGWPRRAWRTLRRRPLTAGLVAVAVMSVLAMVTALAFSGTFRPESHHAPATAEETYRQAVAGALQELADGRTATVIDDSARTPPWRLRAGNAKVLTVAEPDNAFTVTAWEPALLELIPDPQTTTFRIRAELKHVQSFSRFSQVGVYCQYQRIDTDQGAQHFCTRLSYADQGEQAIAFSGPDNARGGQIELAFMHLGDSKTTPYRSGAFTGPYLFLPRPEPGQPRSPWRQITVEVSPTNVKAYWGPDPGQELSEPELQRRGIHQWTPEVEAEKLSYHLRGYSDLSGKTIESQPRGSLGIFLYGSTVAVRRFAIEPLGPDRNDQ